MSIDTEYISEKDFNFKFKNYLRDFYVYQFKNKDIDFFNKSTFLKSRMAAVSILSFVSGYNLEKFILLKMKDIIFENDTVSIHLSEDVDSKEDVCITLDRPLCEMFKYLYTFEKSAFFLTGNTGIPNEEKLILENTLFYKSCSSPKTIEKMYRYWGQIYLDEANETIKNSTYRNDSLRAQAIVRKMAGVNWKYGKKLDHQTNSLTEDEDSCVECITADTRTLKENPFHLLYNYCNRYSSNDEASRGEHFALIYALILYYNLGKNVYRYEKVSLDGCQIGELNKCLITIAEILESEERKHDPGTWGEFSVDDKTLYSYKSIEKFLSLKGNVAEYTEGDFSRIYSYLVENKKRIVFDGNSFLIEDDLETCIDVDKLFEFYSIFVNQQYSIQKRQFVNVIKSLVKIGWFIEKKEINLNFKKKKDYSYSIVEQIEGFLEELNCPNIELIEKVKQRAYVLRYNNDIDEETIKCLKEKIKDNCKGWECKTNNRIYCQLSSIYLFDILDGKDDLENRFSDMISFFSQTMALGEIGNFISKHLPTTNTQFYYKHNYIIRGLNDYNISDLLYAIKKKKWIDIEYRSPLGKHEYQHFICYPIEIRENVYNGKGYLIFYHPNYRSISSVCIDYIDSIRVGDYKKKSYYFFDADIKRAERLIKYTWGNNFAGFFEGNVKADIKPSKVKIVVTFNKNNEKFIRNRIKRETPNGTFKETYPDKNTVHAEIVAEVINPIDMLHWVRSYTTRIVSFEILYNGFVDEIMRTYKMYQIPSQQLISLSLCETPEDVIETIDTDFRAEEDIHSQLFNEIYNISFLKLGDILFDVLHSKKTDENFAESKKQEYLNAFTFDDTEKSIQVKEKREQQFVGFLKNFIFNNEPVFSVIPKNRFSSIKDLMPLTKIEIQWLNNILEHPFAACFLESNEIKQLRKWLPTDELFDINDVVLIGQAVDIKEHYEKSGFADNLRVVIQALHNNCRLNIRCKTQYGTPKNYEDFAPAYIEYSKKDNRFRIRGVCDKGIIETINLERIVSISYSGEFFNQQEIVKTVSQYDENKEEHLVIFFSDIDNVPDKILSEFSCYRKECIRWGNGKYRMILYYNSDDYKEIIIRLLGYGSLITVSEDTGGVLTELKERLANQLVLSNMLNKSRDIEGLEVEYES